jgi:branched-chain amino acid transport system permease protein
VQTHIGAYHILHGVDLVVPKGQLTMLLGRNGAGKTTTLRTIMGLWHASQGSVRLRARTSRRCARRRSPRSASPTCPRPWASSRTSRSRRTCCWPRVGAKPRRQIDDTRLKWIFQLFPAVEKFWNHPAGKLSGGQKQMLAVSRAIVEPRELLVIDEPSKGLAPVMINNMIDAFAAAQGERRDHPAGGAEHQLRAAPGRHRGRDGQRPRGAQRLDGRRSGRGRSNCSSRCWGWPYEGTSDFDWKPLALVPAAGAPGRCRFIGSFSTWLTLTVAGLAMGMIIFIIASGLTLVFGLMDVLNFGHGVFIALGAFVATSVLGSMGDWTGSESLWRNLVAVVPAMLVAMARGRRGRPGVRALHRAAGVRQPPEADPHHDGRDDHRRGADQGHLGPAADPAAAAPRHARHAAAGRGGGREVPAASRWSSAWWSSPACCGRSRRTKLGLLIRAGVQDREMVESLGYRIHVLFVGVFVAGSALAGLGGVMWGLYQQNVVPQMGAQVNVLIFIVMIIGGLGSTGGALIGALLVGLMPTTPASWCPRRRCSPTSSSCWPSCCGGRRASTPVSSRPA